MSGSRTANPFRIFRIFRIFREAGDHRRRGLAGRSGRALLPSMRKVYPIGDRVLIRVVPTRAEGGEWNPVPDGRCDAAAREPPWPCPCPWPFPPGTLGVTGGNGGAPRRSHPDQVPAQRTVTCPGTGPPSHVIPMRRATGSAPDGHGRSSFFPAISLPTLTERILMVWYISPSERRGIQRQPWMQSGDHGRHHSPTPQRKPTRHPTPP